MRKVIASTFVTLDGFTAGKNGEVDWQLEVFNEEMGQWLFNQYNSIDTMLLGRVTYEEFESYWSGASPSDLNATQMNNTAKIVFSTTLKNAGWKNSRLIRDNIVQEVQAMKQQPGKDMVIVGSANLVQSFTQLKLIDEYQLLVYPVVLGEGKPFFKNTGKRLNLELMGTKIFNSGVVILYYKPNMKKEELILNTN